MYNTARTVDGYVICFVIWLLQWMFFLNCSYVDHSNAQGLQIAFYACQIQKVSVKGSSICSSDGTSRCGSQATSKTINSQVTKADTKNLFDATMLIFR